MIVDLNPSNSNYDPSSQNYWVPHYMITIGNTLYFAGHNGSSSTELHKTDGTASGTVMVQELAPGNYGGVPFWNHVDYEGRAAFANNKMFFMGHDYYSGHPGSGYEPWVLDPANITGLNSGSGSNGPLPVQPAVSLHCRIRSIDTSTCNWRYCKQIHQTPVIQSLQSWRLIPMRARYLVVNITT